MDQTHNSYLEQAREVLRLEAESVQAQAELLGTDFVAAVELILNSSGRIAVTGMGKSGLVGRKISATLSSTGTPSFFLHPGEGIHGDLGMVTQSDIIIAISRSGENDGDPGNPTDTQDNRRANYQSHRLEGLNFGQE